MAKGQNRERGEDCSSRWMRKSSRVDFGELIWKNLLGAAWDRRSNRQHALTPALSHRMGEGESSAVF
jgi:hypothetical protein